jgi:hypothetical protein
MVSELDTFQREIVPASENNAPLSLHIPRESVPVPRPVAGAVAVGSVNSTARLVPDGFLI